jgi:hypothetical protein
MNVKGAQPVIDLSPTMALEEAEELENTLISEGQLKDDAHPSFKLLHKLITTVKQMSFASYILQKRLSDYQREVLLKDQEIAGFKGQLAQVGIGRISLGKLRLEEMPDGKTGRVWVDCKVDGVGIESLILSESLEEARAFYEGHRVMSREGKLLPVDGAG